MAGLQGSGKTTTSGKLAAWLKKGGHRPMLVSVDVYRPAAREQLKIVAKSIEARLYEGDIKDEPAGSELVERLAKEARREARIMGCDTLIVDTAGRLHIDEELMDEMEQLKKLLNPSEILFIADAMTGQDAVNSAQDFHKRLGLTGVVLTKMDGDARGGAALSIRHVTGQPIKFIGVGEKPDAFEPFHPDRIVGRILGMGDMMSLIEKAESTLDRKKSEEFAKKALLGDGFTLEDFRDQLKQIKKLGSMESILKMLPSVGPFAGLQQAAQQVDEKQFVRLEAIINSMTPFERRNHEIISGSRRKRIAAGSGTSSAGCKPAPPSICADEQDVQADGQRRPGQADDARRPRRHGQTEIRTISILSSVNQKRTRTDRSVILSGTAWAPQMIHHLWGKRSEGPAFALPLSMSAVAWHISTIALPLRNHDHPAGPTRRNHRQHANLVQPERLAVGERAVEELFASGIEDHILPVGAIAPEFALKDPTASWYARRDLLALGPLVIKFFRGRWCPYCVTELEAWRDLYGQLRERGALHGRHRSADRAAERLHGRPARTAFPVLSDPGNAVAEKFGLVYTVPEYHRDYYLSILVNIPFVNGDKSWRLPLPATYVISQGWQVALCRSPCRFPRAAGAGRSARRRCISLTADAEHTGIRSVAYQYELLVCQRKRVRHPFDRSLSNGWESTTLDSTVLHPLILPNQLQLS